MTKYDFYNNFIKNETEDNFFLALTQIFKKNLNEKKTQTKIEKLVNIYLLKKSENKIIINPFWHEKIHLIFQNELYAFRSDYNNIIEDFNLKEKNNTFIFNILNKIKKNELFTADEVFILFILNFIENYEKINNEKHFTNSFDAEYVLETTFINTLVYKFLDFFNFKFLFYALNEFFIINKIGDDQLSFDAIVAELQNTIKNRYIDYRLIITAFLRKKHNQTSIDARNKLQKDFEKEFLNFFDESKNNFVPFLYKFCKHIEFYFLENKIFNKIYVQNLKNTYTFLEFFDIKYYNKIDFIFHTSSQLPMLITPKNWNYKGKLGGYILKSSISNNNNLDKSLKKGFSLFNYSKFTIDTINLLQSKVYIINKNYLNYIKTFWFKESFQIPQSWEEIFDNEYCNYLKIKEINENLKKQHKYTSINLFLKEFISLKSSNEYKLKNFEEKKKLKTTLFDDYGITEELITNYILEREKEKNFIIKLNMYKDYNFIIKISNIFLNYKLYNVTRLDFRGRFFPLGRVLHRATGKYKYLLDVTDFYIFTEKDYLILKEYISFLILNKKNNFSRKELVDYFDKNILFSKNVKNFNLILHFLTELLINSEIQINLNQYFKIFPNIQNNLSIDELKYIKFLYSLLKENLKNRHILILAFINFIKYKIEDKNFTTNFCIEIDQSSSGPQIYGLLSYDKKIAMATNILSGSIKEDIYIQFLNAFNDEFIQLKNTLNNPKLLKDLNLLNYNEIFNRDDFSKLIIMPKFYNMGDKGLLKLLYKLPIKISDINDYKLFITEIFNLINKTLEKNFYRTLKFQKSLVNIAEIIYQNNLMIELNTLDGSSFNYKYISVKENFGKIYKNGKSISYRLFLPMDEFRNSLDKLHYLTFPPNFIHSIDGALCRIILNLFYQKTNFIIEPLHDSFRIPICFFNSLINLIKYIYSYFFFNKFFHEFKIGLDDNFNIIMYNDFFYEKYIFLFSKKFKNNILKDLFINKLNINDDTFLEIRKLLDDLEKNYINTFDENDFKLFLKSDFMFYF